jgi:transcriptional regulator with XRE-family HTH domain
MKKSPRKSAQVTEQQAFGLAVRARRIQLGVSQETLADDAQLHRTYVGSVERGERNVSLRNIFAIASALQIDPSELISDAESHTGR